MNRSVSNKNKIFFACCLVCSIFLFQGCEKSLGLKTPKTDPVAIFDELWNVMDQRYTMFSVKGINWKDNYDTYHAKLSAGMTDKSLFEVLSDMLESVQDGHVTLISDFDTATYENFYKSFPANFDFQNIMTNYLQSDYGTIGPFIFKIVENIGYIYCSSFEDDITDADAEQIINQMNQTKGLIFDVRNNLGGNSENVNRIFSHFLSEKKLVKYEVRKKGPGHDDFLDAAPFYLSPSGQIYNKPVVVLTNRACFSACNDFVLYMSELPNVTLMGDQTGGGGGIPQNYLLGNGWKLQYTSTITLSPDKQTIENGIVPDINVSISTTDEANGKDPIIEKAFQSLQ